MRGHGIVAAVVSAIVATELAAQQAPVVPQAPLQVTLQEAVRRALDVQPAMVQARGTQRNAGASGRSLRNSIGNQYVCAESSRAFAPRISLLTFDRE